MLKLKRQRRRTQTWNQHNNHKQSWSWCLPCVLSVTCKQFHGVGKGRQHNPTNMAAMLPRFALVVLHSKRAMVCLQWISMMVVVPFVALVPLALGRAWSSRRSTLHMSRRQLTWQRQPKCSFANSCLHSQRMRRRCFSGALALGKKRSWCILMMFL